MYRSKYKNSGFIISVTFLLLLAFSAFQPMVVHSATPVRAIPVVGLNVNYPTPQTFVTGLASQGVTWIRQYGPNQNTPMIHAAGMKILMVADENLFYVNSTYSSYSDVRQLTTAQWYSLVLQTARAYPYITTWEFYNEPTNRPLTAQNTPTWTATDYFKYLVPTYQAIKAANANNVLMGPTVYVWPYLCCANFELYSEQWFQSFWGMSDPATGLTPAKMLTYVSLHIYTSGNMITDTLNQGPYAGKTIGYAIQQGVAQYYSITGGTKQLVIDEFGADSNDPTPVPAPSYAPASWTFTPALQAQYYQQVMDVFESIPYIWGVFAFNWADYGQPTAWGASGLYDYNLQVKPAMPMYEQYFPSGSATTQTSIQSSTSTSVASSTKATSTQPAGLATLTAGSAWLNGTSFSGIYAEVSSNGVLEASGFTPLTATGFAGSPYTISFYYYAPYTSGKVVLDHLSTGGTGNSVTITLNGPTTITAYYRSLSSATTTTTSVSSTSTSSTTIRTTSTSTTTSYTTSTSSTTASSTTSARTTTTSIATSSSGTPTSTSTVSPTTTSATTLPGVTSSSTITTTFSRATSTTTSSVVTVTGQTTSLSTSSVSTTSPSTTSAVAAQHMATSTAVKTSHSTTEKTSHVTTHETAPSQTRDRAIPGANRQQSSDAPIMSLIASSWPLFLLSAIVVMAAGLAGVFMFSARFRQSATRSAPRLRSVRMTLAHLLGSQENESRLRASP